MKSSKVNKKQMFDMLREREGLKLPDQNKKGKTGDDMADHGKRNSVVTSADTNVDIDDDESMNEEQL